METKQSSFSMFWQRSGEYVLFFLGGCFILASISGFVDEGSEEFGALLFGLFIGGSFVFWGWKKKSNKKTGDVPTSQMKTDSVSPIPENSASNVSKEATEQNLPFTSAQTQSHSAVEQLTVAEFRSVFSSYSGLGVRVYSGKRFADEASTLPNVTEKNIAQVAGNVHGKTKVETLEQTIIDSLGVRVRIEDTSGELADRKASLAQIRRG